MSGTSWVISDPHFNHGNILTFKNSDGNPVRSFSSVEEMNETMIERWNEIVEDGDRVYLLGDVAFHPRTFHSIIPRLKGRICLVQGNHEPTKSRRYLDLFDDVRGYVIGKGYIMSHIPLHPDCLSRWKINIHGHLHGNVIDDSRYVNVCVEQTDYRPVMLSKILEEKGITP